MSLRIRLAAGVAAATLALGLVSPVRYGFLPAAQAQNLGQRVVDGMVQSADSAPIQGATVFLRNTKTKSIRSYTSAADGKFRFVQVNMSEDFDLWAEKDGKKSAIKPISTWDTRKEIYVDLTIK
jgi:hypothetical protein